MFKSKENHNEEYYMNMFAYKMKEAWRLSKTDIEGFILARKYLKKAKLNQENHPYLWGFRKRIDKIKPYSMEGRFEMDRCLKEFFSKKMELTKNS